MTMSQVKNKKSNKTFLKTIHERLIDYLIMEILSKLFWLKYILPELSRSYGQILIIFSN